MQGTRISLGIEIYPEALWLRTSFPLSILLKPLCIPWHAIESIDQGAGKFGDACLKVAGVAFPICLSGDAGEKISEMYQLSRTAM
jgi:hypothetical protein